MSSLKYVGPSSNKTPSTRTDLDSLDITVYPQSQIDSLIRSELSDRANIEYVDSVKTTLATTSSVSGLGTGKIPTSSLDGTGGAARLVDGVVQSKHIPSGIVGSRIRLLKYNNLTTGTITNEITNPKVVASLSLPNLGYTYLPVVQGYVTIGGPGGVEVQARYGGSGGTIFGRATSGNVPDSEATSFLPSDGLTAVTSGTLTLVAGTKFSNLTSSIDSYDFAVLCIPA